MKTNFWIIADTHFGHKRIHEMCDRPIGFEQLILDNIRKTIQDNDVIIHLGDFCLADTEYYHDEFVNNCPGKKWLVLGNHDRKTMSWYLNKGWDFVGSEILLEIHGKKISLSHKPLKNHFRYRYDLNIHGHLHNSGHRPNDYDDDKHVLVMCEHEYKPVNLRALCGQ